MAHFIGAVKPWNLSYNRATGQLETGGNMLQNIEDLAYIWWRIFMEDVHHKLIDELVKSSSGDATFVSLRTLPSCHFLVQFSVFCQHDVSLNLSSVSSASHQISLISY